MRLTSIAILALFAGHATLAQVTGNPAGLSPDTPGVESATPAPDHANAQDLLFVRQASLGNRAEVELGKMAQSKGSEAAVKEFAQRMQKEHAQSLERLTKAGRATKVELPKDLDAEHKRVRDELGKLSAAEFDKAYLATQIEAHQRTANLLLWHLSYGQNAGLLRYSADTLPVVLDHLDHAKRDYAARTSTPVSP